MTGYMDSPQYQAMMAEVLRGGQRGPQYPAEAGANALATALQAYTVRKLGEQQQTQQDNQKTDSTNAYASALNNLGSKDNGTWDVGGGMDASGSPAPINVSPAVNATQPQRYAAALRGSPELAKEMGPEIARQLTAPHPMSIGPTGQAYDPLTLKPGESPFGDPRIKSKEQLEQEAAEKAAPGPAPQASVGMTPDAEAQQLRIKEAERAAALADAIKLKRTPGAATDGTGETKPPAGYRAKPDGTLEYIPGGPADPTKGGGRKAPTEDQAKNTQLYERTSKQLKILLGSTASDGKAVGGMFDALTRPASQAAGAVYPSLASGDYQRATNALTDIAASYLYSVSGATANPGEVKNLVGTVTPYVGEASASVADKKARIQQMVDSIKTRANGGQENGPAGPTAPQAGGFKYLGKEP